MKLMGMCGLISEDYIWTLTGSEYCPTPGQLKALIMLLYGFNEIKLCVCIEFYVNIVYKIYLMKHITITHYPYPWMNSDTYGH